TIDLDANGQAFLFIADVVDLATLGDNCGVTAIDIAPGSDQDAIFECDQRGDNEFTFVVSDAAGNETTVTVTVTVEDNLAPFVADATNGLLNGSFESEVFLGWEVENNPAPFRAWSVNDGVGSGNFFFADALPTDGDFLASNGFDGGAGNASLTQTVTLPIDYEGQLTWDENIDYNLAFGGPDAMTRIHQVQIRDDEGKVLEVVHEVMAMGGMVDTDNEWISYSADLTAYAGQTITIAFAQIIPESFTGPAKFALDNIDAGLTNIPTVTLDSDGNVTLDPNDLVVAVDNCGGVVDLAVMPMDLGCENIGPNVVTVVATDDDGNERTIDIPVNVDFVQPNLACIGDLNLTLNDDCQGVLVPEMLLRGDTECLDVFGFDIVVNDDDPSNGPIVDGCGRFSYTITSNAADELIAEGFVGEFSPDNFEIDLDGAAEGSITAEFDGDVLRFANVSDPGTGSFAATAAAQTSTAGTASFDWEFFTNEFVGLSTFEFLAIVVGIDGDNEVTVLASDGEEFAGQDEDGLFTGTAEFALEAGDFLVFGYVVDGVTPFGGFANISNFSFATPNLLALDFETCWGFVNAEDKTPPAVVETPEDVELLCVDLDDNNISTLPASVSRCYEVFSSNGNTVPGTMDPALNRALRAGGSTPLVPIFTDGCTEKIEVCVSDVVVFDPEDPQCNDVELTRTFVATEISTCPSTAGEENPSVTTSYEINFTRPTLADLNDDSIDEVVEYEQCGVANPSRADYPAPRPEDFPFLSVGDRTFPLRVGSSVCNIAVTFEDSEPFETCPYTYKFFRTYTVLDWCDPTDRREFVQTVKVGDTTGPDFFGPTQDRDFDGEVDDDLIYTTNAGRECAAFIRLDAAGVRAVDECDPDVTITAQIFPGGDLDATPIGAFDVDPTDGDAEVTSAIPVGCHLLRYTATDACDNVTIADYDFCVEDGTAPVAICEDGLNIGITSGSATDGTATGIAVLTPDMLDNGSYDDCSDITLAIARVNAANIATEVYDDEIILTCADLGIVRVGLRVTDELGNENFCWLDVLVEDKVAPTCIPPGPVRISCTEYNETLPADIMETTIDERNAVFGSAAGVDNCEVTITETISGDVNSCGVGSFTRTFTTTDGQGFTNTDVCRQRITVFGIHNYQLIFPTDEEAGCATIPDYDEIQANELACDLITTTVDVDTLRTLEAGEECFKLRVTYDVINWCEYNTLGQPYLIPRDGDGIRNPETQLLYLNVVPVDVNTTTDDFAFLSRFSDRNFNSNDRLLDDGDDMDGTDDDNGNDNIDDDAYAADDSRGHFRYIQFVKVYDEVAPTITADEPADCFGGSGQNCEATVVLTFTAMDECSDVSPLLELDANYVAANGFSADNAAALGISIDLDESGAPDYVITATNVPVGNHAIRIRVNDGCGNFDVEILEFCVTGDKAPTPICIQTLTVTLMPDGNGGGMAEIWASDFIASDVEDCFGNVIDKYSIYTEEEAQAIGFAPVVGRLGIEFDCSVVDTDVPVRVYAIDNNGSADYCAVITQVQAFQDGVCADGTGNLTGAIMTSDEEVMAGVQVNLTGAGNMDEITTTDVNGVFGFSGLTMGGDYTVQAQHQPDMDLSAVSTGDVVAVSLHILGSEPFTNTYDFLAADVNNDNRIDVLDMQAIQSSILGLMDNFGTGITWTFVPADVEIDNPFADEFPEVVNVNDFTGNFFGADLLGIQEGDVLGRAGRSVATLEIADVALEAGQTHTIVLDGSGLRGFQGTVELAAGLELLDADFVGEGGLNLNRAAEGLVALSLRNDAVLSLEVRATEAARLSELVSLTDYITPRESVSTTGTSEALALSFVTDLAPAAAPNALLQNTPNPVLNETVIRFDLAVAGPAMLSVQDAAGRLVMTKALDAVAGRNVVTLTAEDLGAAGVLTYTLTSGDFTATKKMVVVR
ncbi:MAG: T9SS type A sorting domain-containing protein, partial [Bacteroidota bacterium]